MTAAEYKTAREEPQDSHRSERDSKDAWAAQTLEQIEAVAK
jgi:hypothetical protein